MLNKLHIITPVTRPQNLIHLAKSIQPGNERFKLTWWIIEDAEKPSDAVMDFSIGGIRRIVKGYAKVENSVAGKGQINAALDYIDNGWVYILDDDNIIHPAFFKELNSILMDVGNDMLQGVTFAQQHRNNFVRYIDHAQMKETHIDQAQYVVKREFIGNDRIPLRYTGDGAFAELLYKKNPSAWYFSNKVLAYYNWLRDE